MRGETARRVGEVARLLAEGRAPSAIEEIAVRRWKVSPRQARNYLRQARSLPGKASTAAQAAAGATEDDLARYRALGDPPADALSGVDWAMRAMLLGLRDVMLDETLDRKQRHDEMRKFAALVSRLVPNEEIYDVKKRVLDENEMMAEDRSPETEHAPKRSARPLRAEAPGAPRRR